MGEEGGEVTGPEFVTRQALANVADGPGVASLVRDGIGIDDMPVGDVALRVAWRELEEAVEEADAAVAKVMSMLPESSQARRWREERERIERD